MKLNGLDHTTDPVLKRLADSDHDTLILARRLQARGPHTEGSQVYNVHDDFEDNGSNQGPVSNVSACQAEPGDTESVPAFGTDSAPPPTEEQQASIATLVSERIVLIEPQSQEAAEVIQTTTTEQEGITEAVTEGNTAHNELRGDSSKSIRRVRDNITDKSLVNLVVRETKAVIRRFSNLTATRSSTTTNSQVAM
jgi:hypothetical protein